MESGPITIEEVENYIRKNIFCLQSESYARKYPKWPGFVGIEVEMMPVRKNGKNTGLIPLQGSHGTAGLLREIASPVGGTLSYLDEDEGFGGGVLGMKTSTGDQFTFEPGGQLEFSSKPYPCLTDAVSRIEHVQQALDDVAEGHGVSIFQSGINPHQTVEGIGLQMTKPRYQAMDAFFSQLGPYGQRMMRQTCTIQVNLDFGRSEATLAKRYLLSNLLAPFATATFANSPMVDGKLTEFASFRSKVWQEMDKSRTGFPSGLASLLGSLNLDKCVQLYTAYVLSSKVVFIPQHDYCVGDGQLDFATWMKEGVEGVFPTLEDFENQLSLHFPEVRARGFLEIRSLDCQGRSFQEVPAAYYTSLLYDNDSMEKALDLLAPHVDDISELLIKSSYGLANTLIADLARQIGEIVLEGFYKLPECYQGDSTRRQLEVFMDRFLMSNRCPADALRDSFRSEESTWAALEAVDNEWARLI